MAKFRKLLQNLKKNICTVLENNPYMKAKNFIPNSDICVKKSCVYCTLKKNKKIVTLID